MPHHLRNQLILVILLLGVELSFLGCSHPTFNVNLGGGPPSETPATEGTQAPLPCYPVRTEAADAEFRAHGYVTGTEPAWKGTRAWFVQLGQLHQKLPDCPVKE